MNNNIRNLVKENYHNLINLNLKNTKIPTVWRQEVSVKKCVGGGGGGKQLHVTGQRKKGMMDSKLRNYGTLFVTVLKLNKNEIFWW